MPRHDPTPADEGAQFGAAWTRYKKLMSWMVLAAIIAVALALLYLWYAVGSVPIHMLIATIAGVGLSVLLGTGLMGLVFLSHNSGHDDRAAGDRHD